VPSATAGYQKARYDRGMSRGFVPGRRVALMVALAGCGRWKFDEHGDGGSAATGLQCWQGAVNLSQNAGASYASSIAADGNAIYAVWTDATGYVHDYANGTENLFFRRIELDGSLVAPETEISRTALGTDRHQFPGLLLHNGQLVLEYTGQITSVDSGGQTRMIHLGFDGVPIGASTLINDDIVAPSPGTTAFGPVHELAYSPEIDRFVVSVYGKFPWGGIGAWNRGSYFVDPSTMTRDGARVCYDNCPPNFTIRQGHVDSVGRAIYRAAADNITFVSPTDEPYGAAIWTVSFRTIDRNDNEIGTNQQLASATPAGTDLPDADMVASDTAQAFVAVWTIFTTGTSHDVGLAVIGYDGTTRGKGSLGTVTGTSPAVRMVQLGDGRIAVVIAGDTQSLAILDASGNVLSPLASIDTTAYSENALLAVGSTQLLISSTGADNDVWLRCLDL
jgi:hypothetical protein